MIGIVCVRRQLDTHPSRDVLGWKRRWDVRRQPDIPSDHPLLFRSRAMATAISRTVTSPQALELPTPKGLFWFARKNCFSSKVGCHIARNGQRVRSQQYYSGSYNQQGLRFAEKRPMH